MMFQSITDDIIKLNRSHGRKQKFDANRKVNLNKENTTTVLNVDMSLG